MRRATNPVASAAQQLDEMCTLAAKDLDQQALVRIRELIDVTSERSESTRPGASSACWEARALASLLS